MRIDGQRVAIALAGFCAFINLYATQSVLPLLAQEFGASAAQVGLTVSATTFAVALVAPFVGVIADVIGRKRIIVAAIFALVLPTAMLGVSDSLHQVVAWRFAQGLLLPPIFAVTIAYIGEEWPASEVAAAIGIYMVGSSIGGFFGRFVSGIVGDHWGWRAAYLVLALITLACGIVVLATLRRERRFVRAAGLRASAVQMARHFLNPPLVATFAVGFAVLFSFVAVFTYVNFHLAAPPYRLSASALGTIFVVYLLGSAVVPLVGRLIERLGRRRLVIICIGTWLGGLALTLAPSLPAIVAGLAIAAASGMVCQTVATSFLAVAARQARSSAVGLYVTFYYIGGSIGGVLPGLVWATAGWAGCLAMVAVVLLAAAALVLRFWAPSALPDANPA